METSLKFATTKCFHFSIEISLKVPLHPVERQPLPREDVLTHQIKFLEGEREAIDRTIAEKKKGMLNSCTYLLYLQPPVGNI